MERSEETRKRRPSVRKPWKKAARIVLWSGAGLVVLLLLCFGFIQTGPGKRVLERVAESAAASQPGLTAKVQGLEGFLPFDIRIGGIALSDAKGPWLAAKDLRFAWSFSALLTGRIEIEAVTADVIRFMRPPDLPPSPPPATPEAPFAWPPTFPGLPPILLDNLRVNRIIVDKEAAGQRFEGQLRGRLAAQEGGAVGFSLDASRTDGPKAVFQLAGALNLRKWTLITQAFASEDAGGVLCSALSPTGGGPFKFFLSGSGPLAKFSGRIKALLGEETLLATDVSLSVPLEKDPTFRMALSGRAAPPKGLLAPDIAALLGKDVEFLLDGAAVPSKDAFSLTALEVRTAPAVVSVSGEIDPDGRTMRLDLDLDVPDLARLSPVAGPGLAGAAKIRAAVSGDLEKPDAKISLSAVDVVAPGASVRSAGLLFDVVPAGKLGEPFKGLTVTGGGDIKGIRGPDGPLPIGDAVGVNLDVKADEAFAVVLDTLSVRAGDILLKSSGKVDPNGPLTLRCDLNVPDLAGALAPAGLPLGGSLDMDARLSGDLAKNAFKALINGELSGLRATRRGEAGKNAALAAALLGRKPSFNIKARLGEDGRAVLETLTLAGRKLRVSGKGGADMRAGTLDAVIDTVFPDLRVLSDPLGKTFAGELEIRTTARGTLTSPDVAVLATGRNIHADTLDVSALKLTANAADVAAAPRGSVELNATASGQNAKVKTGFAMKGATLSLSGLAVQGPATDIHGDLSVDLDSTLIQGKIGGGVTDLGRIGRIIGQQMAGSLRLDAALASGSGGQDVRASVDVSGLSVEGARIASVGLDANLTDVLRAPRGKASLDVRDVSAEGAALTSLALRADGDGGGVGFTMALAGRADAVGRIKLDAKGDVAPQDGGARLSLSKFSGTLGDLPLELKKNAVITAGGPTLNVDSLELAVGGAALAAQGGWTPKAVDFSLTLKNFTLDTLSMAGLEGYDGKAEAEVRLTGSPGKPTGAVKVDVTDVRLADDAADKKIPPLRVAVNADIASAGITASVDLGGIGDKPVSVKAAVPARFSLSPFVFDVPPSGKLEGSVTADMNLADLNGLLERFNTKMGGRFKTDITLAGTVGEPDVRGGMGITDGSLQNAASGTDLRQLELDVQAAGDEIRLVNLAAKDNKEGNFKITGEVDLSPGDDFAVDVSAVFNKARLVNIDMVQATLGGNVDIKGKGSNLDVTGDLKVGPVAVNIPNKFPADVPQVEVTEINNPDAKPEEKREPPEAAGNIKLDVAVEVGDGVFVRGMGLESEWEGKLRVEGTAARPYIDGKINTRQGGGIEVFGRRLRLKTGVVTFNGASPPDPVLNIQTDIDTSDAVCGVNVTGSASSPNIALVSDPPMPNDEVLSRILFGQGAGSITPFQAIQLAQAGATLMAGGGSLDMLAKTRKLVGLDELDVIPGQGDSGGTKLRAGKYLAKGVKVSVDQGMSADSGAVSVEVDITPNISVESRVGADSKQGLGVNWKWDY